MNTADWIALSSSVATFITATVGYLTLLEVGKQRRASYKPELTPARQVVFAYRGSSDSGIARHWFESKQNDEAEVLHRTRYPINIFNLGNGSAKDIRIIWDYEIERLADTVNSLAQEQFRNLFVKYNESVLTIEEKDVGLSSYYMKNDLKFSLDYVLPISANSTPASVNFPMSFIELLSIYFDLTLGSSSKKKGNFHSYDDTLSKIKMNIDYKDIGGNQHNFVSTISVSVMVYKASGDKEVFQAILEQDKA